ncbi:uncharacterized protein METZ01_LOCUS477360 [marine metagenome]|uniref:Uncharacterized protein n=1 Tax=marine metagenome TaxID=408172 RepID=A0A383BW83_9ZZZZ
MSDLRQIKDTSHFQKPKTYLNETKQAKGK